MSALRELAEVVDPALAEHAVPDPGPGRFASVTDHTRAFVLEAVREGYELHYGSPRAFEDLDDDLRLLGGDALYALGLGRLAEAGDLEAVAELADLITACARAQAEGEPVTAERAWAASEERLA
ncbi:MAG: hypothetical protein M3350_03120 [Actinomycetota bacterium]|nr:hypothetical protein [Actinomycetota bacterium]